MTSTRQVIRRGQNLDGARLTRAVIATTREKIALDQLGGEQCTKRASITAGVS
jgi:hypothetical protein